MHRLEHEFGASVELSPTGHTAARRTDGPTAAHLAGHGVRVMVARDGTLLALFDTAYYLQRLEADHPDRCLDPILAGGAPG